MLQQMFNLTATFCEASIRAENVRLSFLKKLLFPYEYLSHINDFGLIVIEFRTMKIQHTMKH